MMMMMMCRGEGEWLDADDEVWPLKIAASLRRGMRHAACSACQKMRKLLIGIANQVGQFWVIPSPPVAPPKGEVWPRLMDCRERERRMKREGRGSWGKGRETERLKEELYCSAK